MAFIRIKKISNKPYAYLVESVKTEKGSRQKVKQYLGRVHSFEKTTKVQRQEVHASNKKSFLAELLIEELTQHGFTKKQNKLMQGKIRVDLSKFTVTHVKKNVIIAINEGYCCTFTLKRLLNFKRTTNLEKDGYTLAQYFLQAGLLISKQEFIQFYNFLK